MERSATQVKANTELINTENTAWPRTVPSRPTGSQLQKHSNRGSALGTENVALGSLGSIGLGPSLGSGI